MKLPCELIRDLLPLYHDGVCSDVTAEAVKGHLEDCTACAKVLEDIDADIAVPGLEVKKAAPLLSIQVSWNKQKRKLLLKCLGAALLAFVLFVGCWWGLTQWCIVPLKGSDYRILNQCQLSDGCIFVEYTWEYGNCARNVAGKSLDEGIEYQTRLRPVLGRTDAQTGHPYEPKNGLYFFPEEQNMLDSDGNLIPVQEIYLGTEKDALLLWARDMELPAAGEAVEEDYRNLLDSYMAPNAPVQPAVIRIVHGEGSGATEEMEGHVQETVVPEVKE